MLRAHIGLVSSELRVIVRTLAQGVILSDTPPPESEETARMTSRPLRRLGYRVRFLSRILGLAAETQAVFSAIVTVPASIATIGIASILQSESPLWTRLIGIFLCIFVPLFLLIYFYLLNLSRGRRADLAVRARRHSDSAILTYLFARTAKLQHDICGNNAKIRNIKDAATLEVETEYTRANSAYVRLLIDQVARHFRVSSRVVEDVLGVSGWVLESRATRRIWLRYNLEHDTSGIQADFSAEAGRIDQCAQRLEERLDDLSSITNDVAKALRFVINQPSTGRALAASARIFSRHVGKSSSECVKALLNLRHGVPPMDAIIGNPGLVQQKEDSLNADDLGSV